MGSRPLESGGGQARLRAGRPDGSRSSAHRPRHGCTWRRPMSLDELWNRIEVSLVESLTYQSSKRRRPPPVHPGRPSKTLACAKRITEKAALATHLRVHRKTDRGRAIGDGGAGDRGITLAAGSGLLPPTTDTQRQKDRLRTGELSFFMGAKGEHWDRLVAELFESSTREPWPCQTNIRCIGRGMDRALWDIRRANSDFVSEILSWVSGSLALAVMRRRVNGTRSAEPSGGGGASVARSGCPSRRGATSASRPCPNRASRGARPFHGRA